MIQTEDIIKIASFFSIIAHTPGRLRVRVNPKITQTSGNITLSDIEDLPNKIEIKAAIERAKGRAKINHL